MRDARCDRRREQMALQRVAQKMLIEAGHLQEGSVVATYLEERAERTLMLLDLLNPVPRPQG